MIHIRWKQQPASRQSRRTDRGIPAVEPEPHGRNAKPLRLDYEPTTRRYPDEDIRLAISRAVAVETSRGWKIGKDKQTHKIDVVVALAMACHAAVTCTDVRPYYNLELIGWVSDDDLDGADAFRTFRGLLRRYA